MKTSALTGLIAVLSFCIGNIYGQSVYHVSAAGDDKNNGLSAGTAIKSIGKINSLVLKPGDSVLFKRGETFRGQLNVHQSGVPGKSIVISAYGSGARPVINGSVIVRNWTKNERNIWAADCPQCGDSVTGVYRNHESLPLGRYPNPDEADKGYLKILSHQGSTQFTGEQAGATNWTGAKAVIRTNDWIIDKLAIGSQNGGTFNLKSNTTYEIKDNWGYFIEDHPATLDQNGEWYYDRANKKLLIWFAGTDPNNSLIEATASGRGINIYASNIVVKDIHVTQVLNIGIYARNASNLVVTNSEISNMGEDAIVINGAGQNVSLKNNSITNANNNGIDVENYMNFTCEMDTLKNIGIRAGMGKSNNGQYMGIQYNYGGNGGATSISKNVLDSVGYIGISFNSSNILVNQNVISDFDLVKNDGGAIHTYNGKNHTSRTNQKIQSNIINNGTGEKSGTTSGYSGATGIYLDVASENIEVTDNTLFNCTGAGIFLHGSNNILVSGNLSFGNNIQFLMTDAYPDGYDSKSNVISNNIFLNRNEHQLEERLLQQNSKTANETSFPNTVFKTNPKLNNKSNLPAGEDAILFEVNKSNKPKNVKLNGSYKDINGNVYHGDMVIRPYGSIILFKIRS